MAKIRLRTKFLLSLIFTTTVLTITVLLIVQVYLESRPARDPGSSPQFRYDLSAV